MISLDQLHSKYRNTVYKLAQKYGISNVRVFGSVSRGEQESTSDLDLLVTVESGRTFLDLVGFQRELSEVLKVRVQAVSDRAISPYMKDRILAEAKKI